MKKILTFAWKQLQFVYSDIGLLLFMTITPLALATIIGLAFGSGGGTFELATIDLAIVNLDEGDGDTNYGQLITTIFTSVETDGGDNGNVGTCSLLAEVDSTEAEQSSQQSLDELFNTTLLDSPDEARQGVEDGTYSATIIIPADFSASLAPVVDFAELPENPEDITITPTSLEIFGNGGAPISSIVVRSVAESITNQIVIGSTTITTTISTLLEDPLNTADLLRADDTDFADFGCAFVSEINPIQLERLPLDDVQAESDFVQILVQMGAAQAVFFAIFTMNNALLSIYNDKRQGILQRLLATPTPRLYIIAGKILGAMALVFFQVGLLLLALTVIASLVMGQPMFIWGNQYLLLLLVTLVVGLSVSGLGVFVIGIASTPEQANIFGTLVALAMAMAGGAFGFSLPQSIQQFSIIYWGVDAYSKLAGGSTDILMNVILLLVVGGVLFVIGTWLFNRRVEI